MKSTIRNLVLISLLFLVSCTTPIKIQHLTGPTMGTTYNIKFWSEKPLDNAALQAKVNEELVRVNKLMSTYDPTSELSLFNQSRSTEDYPLSPDTLLVMREAKRIGHLSDGYLDVTVGPLVNLWGFGPQAKPEVVPDANTVAQLRNRIGLDKFALSTTSAKKHNGELYVDLSTIAKGFGVDQVAEIVEQFGINNYLVEIGGEMRVAGVKPNEEQWRLAIEKPVTNERVMQKVIQVGRNALATSGDYRNYFEEDGRRYSHLIDPKTGYPIQHNLVSVTVVHPSCLVADGFATALNVMGKELGMKVALENNLNVMFITKEKAGFKEYTTPGFEQYVR